MPKHLVISTSSNPDSNSRRMGRVAFAHLQKRKIDCAWIDISKMNLPLCDGGKCYGMPSSKKLSATIEAADGILVAAPVYNYDVAAAAKNMIELDGQRLARQDRGLSLCRRRHSQLYVGHGLRQQPHARFSLRDYSAVRFCHCRRFRWRQHCR